MKEKMTLARQFLQEHRPDKALETVPADCRGIAFESAPAAAAIFPDLKSLIQAIDDFYAPRDPEGCLLERYFAMKAETNKGYVDELLQSLKTWGELGFEGSIFQDPQRNFSRNGRGDILDYRETALDSLEIAVVKQPNGTFVLNQPDVGIFAGTDIAFSTTARLAYQLEVPLERPDDVVITLPSGSRATLRPIDIVPADSVAWHIKDSLDPSAPHRDKRRLRNGIICPKEPYDVFKPSATVEVGGATVEIKPKFHDSRSRAYLPPYAGTRTYGKVRALITDTGTVRTPDIEIVYRNLSPLQAGVVWSIAQLQEQPPGI